MGASADINESAATRLDYSNLSQLILPNSLTLQPGSIAGTALAHGDYVDAASAQTIAGAKTFTAPLTASKVSSGPGGINLGYANVLDYGYAHVEAAISTALTLPAVSASVAVVLATAAPFLIGDLVAVFDYQSCFYGTISAGAGTTTLTIQCTGRPFTSPGVTTLFPSQGMSFVVRDDSAAISTAIATGKTIYFPAGHYATSSPITFGPFNSCASDANSIIVSCGAADCFIFGAGQFSGNFNPGSRHELPSIFYFSGKAISFPSPGSGARVYSRWIFGVGYGIYMAGSLTGTFGHIVRFDQIISATYGIYCDLASTVHQIQGAYFGGPQAFIGQCSAAIYIRQAVTGLNYTMSANIFELGGINGNDNRTRGIVFDAIAVQSANLFRILNSFGAFGARGYIAVVNGAIVTGQHFEFQLYEPAAIPTTTTTGAAVIPAVGANLALNVASTIALTNGQYKFDDTVHAFLGTIIAGGGTTALTVRVDVLFTGGTLASGAVMSIAGGQDYLDFNAFATPGTAGQVPGNTLKMFGASGVASGQLSPQYYTGMTATNTRSSFNGGSPLYWKRIVVGCTLPAMASGAFANFYAYSPFTSGIQYQPKGSIYATNAPIMLAAVQDEAAGAGVDGNTAPNQILMRVQAFATVSAGQFVYIILEFLD